ncbi:non-structural maintenance of chromosomes element 3 homolog isoform X2 [Amyelois transitella]|uniref:non-structural maintenance of chromosomes element 3 homolog isoform X2 n=1 Tax=Amyelois transitella TaxID=680683 RepID=UPI00298F89FF|nr:non-structural maintenance of chromosomes element 3 homolog isoform X2 [Amyelois transitella]
MSQRRTNRSTADAEESVDEEAVTECVRYIICRESSKFPIKRAEILKHLTTTTQTPANQVKSVLVEANKILKQVYGYKLVQVEAKSGIQYIVVLNEECESLTPTCIDPLHRRLLIAALMHIFMTGGPVKEDDMWKFLSEAGLMEENDHGVRKILTSTFTRQMYLQYSKAFDKTPEHWCEQYKEAIEESTS